MKKLFKPANIIFYILMAVAFFIVGIFYAKITGAGEGQMLAAAAIIVGWGVLFGGIAFIASFFIAWYTNPAIIKRLNWGLLVAVIVTIGIVRYLNPREDKVEQERPGPVTKPTAPAADPVDAESIALPIL